MAEFGVTTTGFNRKRLADILDDLVEDLSAIEDPVTGEQLTPNLEDENDPLIQLVNAFADSLSVAWEQAEAAHNQFDPLKAIGAALSGLVQLNSIRRKAGTYSTVVLTLTGSPNSQMAAGKQVSTIDDSAVFNLPLVTFDSGGSASVVGTATEEGPIAAVAGSVVKILTPYAGWTAVTNSLDAVPGTLEETDSALRLRQQESTTTTANAIIESLYAGIIDLAGVAYCRVFQNITLAEDSRGIPAKQVAAVVVGGDDDEIADVLFQKVSIGCETYGTTTVNKTDVQGITYPMKFSRPAEIEIYVAVAVTVVNSTLWGDDGPDNVKAAIVAYASQGASALGIDSGYDQDGYAPGESVYASELYTPVNSALGIKITSITVGITDTPVDSEVAVAWNEIASFDSSRISVVVS